MIHTSAISSLEFSLLLFLFFFNDTATTEIYTLSLHDALPISCARPIPPQNMFRSDSSRIRSPAGRRCESPGSTSSDPDSGRSRGLSLHTKRPPPRWIGENASIRDEPTGLRDSEQAECPFVCQPARFPLPAVGSIALEVVLTMLPSRMLIRATTRTWRRARSEGARNALY